MEQHKQADPALAAVLAAIKVTVKGGVGKLRERPQGRHYEDGERWLALECPTWRPDIRAAVISKARVNMHRKMLNMAEMAGLYPLAVISDRVVYPSPGRLAVSGDQRFRVDCTVHCGPAMGAFNTVVADTGLHPWRARTVEAIAPTLMDAAHVTARLCSFD